MRAVHEAELRAEAQDIWRALVDPELTIQWYHGSRVAADWRPGGEVIYRFPDGTVVESGVVADIAENRRLALETRFLFDEEVSKEPAHRTIWDLEPGASSTHVRVTFDVPDEARLASQLLGEEGEYELRSLRLAVDPAEQARVARRDVIGDLDIRDLTPGMVGDYQHFFDDIGFQDHPEWQGCYCAEVNLPPEAARTIAATRARMTELIERGEVTALMAFADGEPVGWCNYGETTRLAGVMAKLGLEGVDHEKVGSVACFVISSQYRRHGLARGLLEAACSRLADRGCSQVEAYPPNDSDSDYPNYRGPLRMYLQAGFEPYREAGKTLIVRRFL